MLTLPRARRRDLRTMADMAIARFPSIVIDCPDPVALATFYGAMLDWKVDVRPDWVDIRADDGQCNTFQRVDGYTPPVTDPVA